MPLTRRPRVRACIAIAGTALALVLTGCGGSNGKSATSSGPVASASTVDGAQQVTIRTGDDLRFHPDSISVHPGQVRVVLVNEGKGPPHDWQLPKMPAAFVPLASAGQTKEATFTAPTPGRYQFVCTIHVRQGQVGTLIVADR
jgi:plastocyanin